MREDRLKLFTLSVLKTQAGGGTEEKGDFQVTNLTVVASQLFQALDNLHKTVLAQV